MDYVNLSSDPASAGLAARRFAAALAQEALLEQTARLEATLIQDDVPTKDGKRVPFAVRLELNLCRDGQPPSEGIDLDAASRALSGESRRQ